jgi:ribosomal protein S3AE
MQVKCTSCGASQDISQAQNCDYCGNLIELESGKFNYQKDLQSESGNLMAMAETAVEATNWEEALSFYNQVLTKEITNSDAWLGKGIAMVYSSRIGDLKINEAIVYWKNAIKHAQTPDAMNKRIAKEIDDTVNKFYPVLEAHFAKFQGLENSYRELVQRFITLEAAQDYAVQLDPDNIKYSKTGYALCKRVIEGPKAIAANSKANALGEGIAAAISGNKYAQSVASDTRNNADSIDKEISKMAKLIFPLEEKYIQNIQRLNPAEQVVSSKAVIEKEEKSSTTATFGCLSAIVGGVLVYAFAHNNHVVVAISSFGLLVCLITYNHLRKSIRNEERSTADEQIAEVEIEKEEESKKERSATDIDQVVTSKKNFSWRKIVNGSLIILVCVGIVFFFMRILGGTPTNCECVRITNEGTYWSMVGSDMFESHYGYAFSSSDHRKCIKRWEEYLSEQSKKDPLGKMRNLEYISATAFFEDACNNKRTNQNNKTVNTHNDENKMVVHNKTVTRSNDSHREEENISSNSLINNDTILQTNDPIENEDGNSDALIATVDYLRVRADSNSNSEVLAKVRQSEILINLHNQSVNSEKVSINAVENTAPWYYVKKKRVLVGGFTGVAFKKYDKKTHKQL